jgi:hypothetical protein
MVKRDEIGFYILIGGLVLSVSAYVFSFMLAKYTDICIVDGILDSINKLKLENCIAKNMNFDMLVFYIGFAGIILLVIATISFSKLSFKKPSR